MAHNTGDFLLFLLLRDPDPDWRTGPGSPATSVKKDHLEEIFCQDSSSQFLVSRLNSRRRNYRLGEGEVS